MYERTNRFRKTKNHRKKHRKNRTKRNTSSIGGEAIGSGGYGCVFFPAIGCQTDKKKRLSLFHGKPNISKLMTKKHAKEEYDFIQKFLPKLRKIKHFERYFLVSQIQLCENLSPLTQEDFKGTEKCGIFKKMEGGPEKINENLDKFATIQMPFGGHEVGDYIRDAKDQRTIKKLSDALIDVLLHAVIPMNELGIYHMDIKKENILVSTGGFIKRNIHCSLIDWGLAVILPPKILNDDGTIPADVYGPHSLQYNIPFSYSLFNNEFMDTYNAFIKTNPKPEKTEHKKFLYNFVFYWVTRHSDHHMSYILQDLIQVYGEYKTWKPIMNIRIENIRSMINSIKTFSHEQKERLQSLAQAFYHIVEYWIPILNHYTDNGSNPFRVADYFKEIFVHNVDVYGWLTCYLKIIHELPDSHAKKRILQEIMKHHLYNPDRINVKQLISDLEDCL